MSNSGDEGLGYWLRWQVPVCALFFLLPAIVAIILIFKVKRAPLNAIDLWIPCWRRLHPVWLLVYRAFVFFLMSWMLLQLIADHGAFAFYFYTQWTFTLVVVYFALGTVISAHGCWMYSKYPFENAETGELLNTDLDESTTTITYNTNKISSTIKLQSHHEKEEIERRAGFWGYMMQTVYQTCAGAVMLTDIVFWGLIVPFLSNEHFSLNLLMGCMHSLNALFLLLDTSLNSLPFPWFRMAYFVLWSCLYVTFQWVLHACGFSWWPYPFLELSTPWAPVWYFCMALIHIPCYGLYSLIFKAKQLVFSRLFPHAYIRSH
ncbi:protein rolling protein isoform X2 [Tasmannia lanceolata]|uniref:protein rolling protein isoform X2 n=1 Tax=Tasmannia lanceolata TaxID=3420 RepID=UPI004063A9D1